MLLVRKREPPALNNVNTQFLLTRYALERMLYRLAVSEHRDSFLLKGALLFDLWYDVPLRPTRDIDLLGFGMAEIPHLIKVFDRVWEGSVEHKLRADEQESDTRHCQAGRLGKKPRSSCDQSEAV